jgi:hypothetical protein
MAAISASPWLQTRVLAPLDESYLRKRPLCLSPARGVVLAFGLSAMLWGALIMLAGVL